MLLNPAKKRCFLCRKSVDKCEEMGYNKKSKKQRRFESAALPRVFVRRFFIISWREYKWKTLMWPNNSV